MFKPRRIAVFLTAALLVALAAATALAHDREDRSLTIVTDEGETFVCHFSADDNIRMFNKDTGEEVFVLDLAELEETVEEAMAEVQELLGDLELDLHFGDGDNFLRFAEGDDEIILDMDVILDGVAEAVAVLGDMDFLDQHHRFKGGEGMEELEAELDALREEMRELKKEMKREQRRARH